MATKTELELIRSRFTAAGLSQHDIEKMCGINSKGYLKRVILATTQPDRLAWLAGCSLSAWLHGTVAEQPVPDPSHWSTPPFELRIKRVAKKPAGAHSLTMSERGSRACKHRWLLAYGLGLRTRQRDGARRRGSLWHMAMEFLWDFGNWDSAQVHAAVMEKLQAELDADVRRNVMSEAEATVLLRSTSEALIGYINRWWPTQSELDTIAVEQRIDAPVGNAKGIPKASQSWFGGILDRVVVDRRTGRQWLMEHKSTMGSEVSELFLEKKRYEPQAAQYALLWEHQTGTKLAGVVYDVAALRDVPDPSEWGVLKVTRDLAKKPPKNATVAVFEAALALHQIEPQDWHDELRAKLSVVPDPAEWPKSAKGKLLAKPPANATVETLFLAVEASKEEEPPWYSQVHEDLSAIPDPADWPVTQRGEPGLSKVIPSGATTRTFLAALQMHGLEFGCQEWHQETLETLQARERDAFQREWVPFEAEQIERMANELRYDAADVRADRRIVQHYRAKLERAVSTRRSDAADIPEVVEVLHAIGDRFPRNGRCCYDFNRPCDYLDLCYSRQADTAQHLRISTSPTDPVPTPDVTDLI